MHGGKKRQRPAAKKPLAEIDAAIEALRVRAFAAQQELYRLILTVGSLSKDERDTLFIAANKAIVETMTWNGFQLLELRKKFERANAQQARGGKAQKACAWHEEAEKLAAALWEKRTDFRHNAEKTAQEIHPELVKACRELGLTAPKAGTVAKFIAAKMKTAG